MPTAQVNGVSLFYEEVGEGTPLVFVHEFAGEARSWHLQVRFFARRYRTIAYNARGYPPSDVPEDPKAYSQDQAADDIRGLLDALGIRKAHICGLSMGGYATLHFGLRYPERALSLVVAGAGYGSVPGEREKFRHDVEETARRFERDGMKAVAEFYTKGPTRVQFKDKDPAGWQEFYDMFCAQSAKGHALTMRGVQMSRPSVYELEAAMERMTVPTLIVTGDEDEPCLEPGIFMKRKIRSSALVVMPKAGHTVNLEDPDAFNRAVLDFLTAVDAGRWPLRNPASVSASAILPPEPANPQPMRQGAPSR
jgi:pimeloyl-ACP methyl ester carboxylesterase